MKRQPRWLALALLLGALAPHARAQEEQNPGVNRPVTAQEIERLRRQINEDTLSTAEAVFEYRNESGDLNHALHIARYGGRASLRWGGSARFNIDAARTAYIPLDDTFGESGTNLTAGLDATLSDVTDLSVAVGATRFSTGTTTINASASVRFAQSDRTAFNVTAARTNVEESLLSATGLRPVTGPFADQLVGRVMDSRLVFGGSSRLLPRLDVFAEGGLGFREGANTASNDFRVLGGGAGYNIVARPEGETLSLLRVAYDARYFGFDEDRFGFGGASLLTPGGRPISASRLGADGISPEPGDERPGVGGYFSPRNFFRQAFQIEAKGQVDRNLSYRIAGFFGSQYYTGSSRRPATSISGTAAVHLSDRLSIPVTYMYDNVGPFTQQWLSAKLAVLF